MLTKKCKNKNEKQVDFSKDHWLKWSINYYIWKLFVTSVNTHILHHTAILKTINSKNPINIRKELT